MAEFAKVMRDWRRMCLSLCNCDCCPIYALDDSCTGIEAAVLDADTIEQSITAWAAEHPESIYPTWQEYLTSIGVIRAIDDDGAEFRLYDRIPADIAEKLGIAAEGVDNG